VQITNPFADLTKGEQMARVAAQLPPAGWEKVAAATVSCGKLDGRTFEGGNPNLDCGLCYPCVIRRGAFFEHWRALLRSWTVCRIHLPTYCWSSETQHSWRTVAFLPAPPAYRRIRDDRHHLDNIAQHVRRGTAAADSRVAAASGSHRAASPWAASAVITAGPMARLKPVDSVNRPRARPTT
jgi:hypothetical protein